MVFFGTGSGMQRVKVCRRKQAWAWLLVLMICPAVHAQSDQAQTFRVSPESSAPPRPRESQAPGQKPQLGWGSNIQNARLARAAEMALKEGRYAAALDYAQRASQAAPNDPQLWF